MLTSKRSTSVNAYISCCKITEISIASQCVIAETDTTTEHSEAKLEQDLEEKHRFILKIDCVSEFQWFLNKAKEFLARLGIKPKEPKCGPSLGC